MYGCKICVNHSCVKENGRITHKCSEFPENVYFGFLDTDSVIKEDCGCFTRIKTEKSKKMK